ncbi:type II toxin-antitoxin system HicB family antitoxin [Xanthobacter dioxanivorans]|uniref:Type II toxin-antitoxin system HicB family antitoxin n=1 Tax=Xanthobacter dioxanivorans TaxID=2528964 RepID=A0A974PQK3_9HYPH|nr:type II toxin-antitoxin system HicB family antitoxin [Xanthobacter dioxanivorans]QRG07947.1 type II toxin-antitoxin system HicB family antitoxin [Xanthobacter dioxanivorans]
MTASTAPDPSAYPAIVASIPPEEGGGFVASFPDVPGCHGVGDTAEEAVADGRLALFACLDALRAADRSPPAPGSAPA